MLFIHLLCDLGSILIEIGNRSTSALVEVGKSILAVLVEIGPSKQIIISIIPIINIVNLSLVPIIVKLSEKIEKELNVGESLVVDSIFPQKIEFTSKMLDKSAYYSLEYVPNGLQWSKSASIEPSVFHIDLNCQEGPNSGFLFSLAIYVPFIIRNLTKLPLEFRIDDPLRDIQGYSQNKVGECSVSAHSIECFKITRKLTFGISNTNSYSIFILNIL